MKILKFGGSSVATSERIKGVAKILQQDYREGEKFAVVFSAFGGVTDQLIHLTNLAAQESPDFKNKFEQLKERHYKVIHDLFKDQASTKVKTLIDEHFKNLWSIIYGISLIHEVTPRVLDLVLSFGERNSALIIANYLRENGVGANYLDARTLIKTDTTFGNAKTNFDLTIPNIQDYFKRNPDIQIITGFIGSTVNDVTTTLGRGGSDFTASIFASALNARLIEIWTDVNGVLTADPRKVAKAFTIPKMSFAEAMEMSHFGAKVIYPPTIQPALEKKIPIAIKNTFKPDFPGTIISSETDIDPRKAVKGISSIGEVCLLTLQGSGLVGVPGTAARLFNSLAKASINIILITQGSSEHSISFAVQPTDAKRAKAVVEEEFNPELFHHIIDPIKVEDELTIIAAIGENMRFQPGISGRLFQALGRNGVNVVAIAQGSSELNISVVIPKNDEKKALNALHEAFFLSDTKELHLFMVGVGLIGKTLIEQIKSQSQFLRDNYQLELVITGLANSKKMVFKEEGVSLDNWKEELDASETQMEMSEFVAAMKSMNRSNSIFLDNTASDTIPKFYESILDSSIAISTPNKIAASSPYSQYQRLLTIARKRNTPFFFETNVGAGLPVITTLKDLIDSGDRIEKIEAVLSGTLSYIFNNLKEGILFSEIVKEAMELGLTEPDPRVDLSLGDVQKKATILGREAGIPLEYEEVFVQPLLPDTCFEANSIGGFFEQLEKEGNKHIEQMRVKAEENSARILPLAIIEKNKASIEVTEIPKTSPFYNLSGSDNMIVFTTARYKERPLVIQGPGAGAEVTSAGLFAEIIRIGNLIN